MFEYTWQEGLEIRLFSGRLTLSQKDAALPLSCPVQVWHSLLHFVTLQLTGATEAESETLLQFIMTLYGLWDKPCGHQFAQHSWSACLGDTFGPRDMLCQERQPRFLWLMIKAQHIMVVKCGESIEAYG